MCKIFERTIEEKIKMMAGMVVSFSLCTLFIPPENIDNLSYWFGGQLSGMMLWDIIMGFFYEHFN